MCYKDALPTVPDQSGQDISDNDIDNTNFKELPFEAEFYRTSTDRDEFVRPIPDPEENEIDEGDDGIDLDGPEAHTPECTYIIAIKQYYQIIEDLDLRLEGTLTENESKNNATLEEFNEVLQQNQAYIIDKVKGQNRTNEILNDVINYMRQQFLNVFGYEDYCGVATTSCTYFTKSDTLGDVPQTESEETTELTAGDISNGTETSDDVETTEQAEAEEDATEEYQTKTLTRPKLSEVVQDTINAYKALNNWKYAQQS